ncbi:uncharacterized protein LOC133474634 isoform X2 [Phyllopteryx taeniolatus]|uniref:uncharacterized protein LOC133474634 isoform X2 n=1 Tax=Phyllopteryx taeniolatus TaxID=161469 RepID=UPI002AD2E8D1|nr:uncharacterized protein LOC133474634 isoform X2 [Phyllopteryx taeniolatus]
MEARYNQFESSPERFELGDQNVTLQKGMKRILVYLLYGILVSLLLIQLMVTGIKFSQLNLEITDIKFHLERLSHQASGGGTTTSDVHLEKRVPVRGSGTHISLTIGPSEKTARTAGSAMLPTHAYVGGGMTLTATWRTTIFVK